MAGLLDASAQASTPAAPEFRFAYHTREGVASREGHYAEAGNIADMQVATEGIKAADELAPKLYEGYIKADLTNQLNDQAINPFLENRGMPPNTGSAEQEAINSKAVSSAEVQQKEPGVFNDVKKLAASFKQGRMTQAQFETNLRAVTKAAVARNPGFMNQLIDHAQHVEYLSGVRLLGDPSNELAKQAAKQQQEIKKDIFSRAKTNSIPYDSFKMDDPLHQQEILQKVMEKEHQNDVFNSTKKQGEMVDIEDKYIGKQAEALVPTWRQGSMNNFVTGMNNIIDVAGEAPSKEVQGELLQQLVGLANQHKAMLSSELSKRRVSAPIANQQLKQHSEALDAMAKLAQDRITGKTTADMYKNDVTIMDSHLKMQALSVVNPHNAKMLRDLNLGIPGMVDAIMANPSAQYALTTGAQDLLNGLSSQNASDVLTKRTLGHNNTDCGVMLENCFNKVATGETNVQSTTSQMLSGIAAITVDLKDKMQGMDINQRIEAQRNIVNVIGMSKYRDVQVMDEEGKRHAHNITTDFMQYAGRAYSQRVSTLREDGYKINTEFMPNGQMMITSPDAPKNIVDDLNRKYSSAWNSGVKAMSNIYKNTWKDASGMIIDLQGTTWGIEPGTNPIEGVVPATTQKKSDGGLDVNAKDMIKQEEGFRNSAYIDSAGVPTIGYGFTTVNGEKVKIGDTMTTQEAEAELQIQLPKYQTFKDKIKVNLSEDQEAALTSFEYNLGGSIWDKGAKSILYAVNSGDFAHARELMLKYDKARDPKTGQLRQLPGLTNRRGREANMLAKN